MSFDLRLAVEEWKKSLFKHASLEDGAIEELTSHLQDSIDRLKDEGWDERTAFRLAVESLGFTGETNAEFDKARAHKSFGLTAWIPTVLYPGLLLSYTRLTLRKIRRHKGFSFINIAGLAIGIACCILILVWVQDELSYDRFHEHAGRTFRIITENHAGDEVTVSAGSPAPLGRNLVETFPDIQESVRVQSGWNNWFLHYGEKTFTEEKLAAVDPAFFEIFSFPFLKGDPKTALIDPHSIVLTERLATKCFADEDPMGKVMQMDNFDLKVTGVVMDIPHNSHFQFDYAFPAENMREWRSSQLDSWDYMQFATYVLLREGADAKALNGRINATVKKFWPESELELYLQPLKGIHLNSSHMNSWMTSYPNPGNIIYVYLFSLIAACVLVVACINFMNLATARYGTRAKEIGLRKVVGAKRKDLIKQFMGESCFLSLVALLFAVLLVVLLLPAFNSLSGKSISMDYGGKLGIWIGILTITLLTGLISGSYPALFLSSFRPTQAFKAGTQLGFRRGGTLRRILVVTQFVFTIVLIICTTVIYRQLHYIQDKDLGYDTENIFLLAGYGDFDRNFEAAKAELLQNPLVQQVCRAFPPGAGFGGTTQVDWEGKDPSQEIRFYSDYGDYDFADTFGIQMAAGRFYSREFSTDPDNFVVNETAVRMMGLMDAVGKKLSYKGKDGVIIGVVKDYIGGSLHEPIRPKVIELSGGFFVCIKFRSGSIAEIVGFAEEKWAKFVPGEPYRYRLVDEQIANYYLADRRIAGIVRNFTVLAGLIACLGLFGLASFLAERRTKEIGIRKVLGAEASSIVFLLSQEFTKWVLLSNLLAWPAAFLIARKWLAGFAYRTRLGWEIFVFSALLALLIALFSVGSQALRAAVADPVQSLRYE